MLRPRLDAMFGREGWAEQGVDAMCAELDAAFAGLKVHEALPVLLRAYEKAPEPVRKRLDEVVPPWLAARGYRDTLFTLFERGAIYEEGRPTARAWLERAGMARGALEEVESSRDVFFRAFAYSNAFQGTVQVYWYADRRRLRVRGLSFLIDYNPPWEGAVKDIVVLPTRAPEDAIASFVKGYLPLEEVEATEAKRMILTALQANREQGIRLPRDLIAARALFLEHVLTLPDAEGTPRFSAADFDELARTGRPAEALVVEERLHGGRTRLPDGSEVLILDLAEDDLGSLRLLDEENGDE
jgi:hypothetical protein